MSTITALLQHKVKKSSKKPLRWLRKAAFQERSMVCGPFGDRDIFPCDYLTTGGRLKLVEKYIQQTVDSYLEKDNVLARKSLAGFREDARTYIHKATNCSEDHVVIFTENEFPQVFASYFNALDILRLSSESERSPVVFVGQDLWHSLHETIKKFGADPLEIQLSAKGLYDVKQLDAFLKFHKKQGRVLIGVFSVGDEVSGTIQDTKTITGILHSYGSLSIWDYTSVGAFTKIDMCPLVSYEGLTNKDAAFIQTDKLLGGRGAGNVLITIGSILRNSMFETIQEGIVAFCTVDGRLDKSLSPHSTVEQMESPQFRRQLVESPIRARAVFELKGYFGDCFLQTKTSEISALLTYALREIPSIYIIGNPDHHPLPYFSLFFSHVQTEWALHPKFVLAVLSDLFGILGQTLPISIRHLPPSPQLEYQRIIHNFLCNPPSEDLYQEEIMNISCVHLSLMHFMRDIDLDFLLACIRIVADEGWRLLPLYRFDAVSGEWYGHKTVSQRPEVLTRTLSKIKAMQSTAQSVKYRHVAYIERAKKAIISVNSKTVTKLSRDGFPPQGEESLSPAARKHRWFMTPADARDLLDEGSPVRLATNLNSSNKKKVRSWTGTSSTSPNSPSLRIANASYKRRFAHV